MDKVNFLYIGTSGFAMPILASLTNDKNFDLVGVVTQPDKPQGRHQSRLVPSEVKQFVLDAKSDVPVFQPENLKQEAESILDQTKPDLIIVASYGQMVPKAMLDYPRYGCLNVHASLLSKFRGAVPIPMAILQGLDKTGVTIQKMVKKLDAGDIIAQYELDITDFDTTESLTIKLSKLAAEELPRVVEKWINGEIKAVPQDESQATFCSQDDIAKDKAFLSATDDAIAINRKIRAFYPAPVARSILKSTKDNKQKQGIEANSSHAGKLLLIYKAKVIDNTFPHKKGLKFFKSGKKLLLRADIGWVEILECQLEGKSKISGDQALFLAADQINSVRGAVIHDDKVLLIKRRKVGKEYYIAPGGAIGVNESEKDAVEREILEETGLKVEAKDYIFESIRVDSGVQIHHRYYSCELAGDFKNPEINGEEMEYNKDINYYEPVWLNLSEIANKDIQPDFKNYLLENFVN